MIGCLDATRAHGAAAHRPPDRRMRRCRLGPGPRPGHDSLHPHGRRESAHLPGGEPRHPEGQWYRFRSGAVRTASTSRS